MRIPLYLLAARWLAAPETAAADDAMELFICLENPDGEDGDPVGRCAGMIAARRQMERDMRTSMGATGCLARKTLAWDGVLNGQYRLLRERLSPEQAEMARRVRRDRIRARDSKCAMAAELYARFSRTASAQ